MRWVWALFTLTGCLCGEPSPSPPAASPSRASAHPRLPRGFDAPLPSGLTPRWGHNEDGRAIALLTAEGETEEAVDERAGRALRERGWTVRRQGGEWVATDGGREVARVHVSTGLSGTVRVEVTQPRAGRWESEPEPRDWRRVAQPPLPAPPGALQSDCALAVREACESWSAQGGGDALDCALDHRSCCGITSADSYLLRSMRDATSRLEEALRAHDRVGSEPARAETGALVALERLCASSSFARGRAAELDAPPALERWLGASEGFAIPVEAAAWW